MGRKVTPGSENLSLGTPNHTGLPHEALEIQ